MCKEVIVDGECCSTHGELKAEIGGDAVFLPAVTDVTDQDCLCGLDVEATAKQYGLTVEANRGWEVILRK